jgi:hypothetical protein
MTQNEYVDDDLAAFMAIARAVAVEEAKTMPTTPELLRRADAIVEAARDRLARVRREELARRPSNIVSGTVRDWIKALSPAQVIAQLAQIKGDHPEMQFAFRDYEHMSSDDLRSALEDVMSLIERGD